MFASEFLTTFFAKFCPDSEHRPYYIPSLDFFGVNSGNE
jgi:hypothetical protein